MKALLYTLFGMALFYLGLNQMEYGRYREAVGCFMGVVFAYAWYATEQDG